MSGGAQNQHFFGIRGGRKIVIFPGALLLLGSALYNIEVIFFQIVIK